MAKFAGLAKNGRERPFGYLSALIKRREGVGLKTHFIFSPSTRAQKLPQLPTGSSSGPGYDYARPFPYTPARPGGGTGSGG